MNAITIDIQVQRISHMFNLDGSITPCFNIFPYLTTPEGGQIKRIPLPNDERLRPGSDTVIAAKDKIRLTIFEDLTIEIKILEKSERPRSDLKTKTCPYCGQPLFPGEGIGRCVNWSCPAQVSKNTLVFTSSCGLVFNTAVRRLFECILVRGALKSPVDLFRLSLEDLALPVVSPLESQVFLQYVHSIRGRTSAAQVLRGLIQAKLSEEAVIYLDHYFETNDFTMLDLHKLMDVTESTECDLTGWKEFCTLPTNRETLQALGFILHR